MSRRGAARRPMAGRRLAQALALAVAFAVPASGAVDAATDGTVTGRVLASPIDLALRIQPSMGTTGSWLTAVATVRNLGLTVLRSITVRLRAAVGLVVRPATARSVRRLASGSAASVSWSICGLAPGAYLVFAEASYGAVIVDSAARVITITSGSRSCSRRRA